MRRIYVASSWRNPHHPSVVDSLRRAGHAVYDFRNPSSGGPPTHGLLDGGFHWSDIDPDWKAWGATAYREAVTTHPLAEAGFDQDFAAVEWADTCVLLLPCGRSAHLEAGFMRGSGKTLAILLLGNNEPELMYRWAHHITVSLAELTSALDGPTGPPPPPGGLWPGERHGDAFGHEDWHEQVAPAPAEGCSP